MSKTILPILYKYTNKGQVQQWQITVVDDYFFTEEGIKGGTLTTSKPTYCKAKNVGRANATTPKEQALAEAQAKWQKKVDSGYNEVLSKEKKFFEPMLAHDLAKYEKLVFTVPTFLQPKLDGLRAISQNNTLASRNGKPYIIPHLYQGIEVFDGELYNHDFCNDFNKIVSLCKKQAPNHEEMAEQKEKVEFWVYDLPSHDGKFSERFEKLRKMTLPKGYVLVPTVKVKNQAELDQWHGQFFSEGYEGSIIRLDLGPYENKRSKQLLKKKDFIDEEFKIIGATEGDGGRVGTIGFFTLEHDTDPSKTFKSNVKGDFGFLAEVWKDKDKYIGTKATIKYQNRTPDGIPRFPYITKLNREEYE